MSAPGTGGEQLARALTRWRQPRHGGPPLRPEPTNAFEVAMAERLKALEAELEQLRSRVNWLLTLIVGAAVTNVVIALVK